jgi:hypothetical protein
MAGGVRCSSSAARVRERWRAALLEDAQLAKRGVLHTH